MLPKIDLRFNLKNPCYGKLLYSQTVEETKQAFKNGEISGKKAKQQYELVFVAFDIRDEFLSKRLCELFVSS